MSAALDAARAGLPRERAWVVGGAVRDRLLGRPVDDVDLVVDGDARMAAQRLATSAGGPCFALSDAFGAWRVIAPDRAWQIDLTPLDAAAIEENLVRRDFTVNAIAEPLGGGSLIDPSGGADDLAARRLRAVGDTSFSDDPLRTVRLARFACELGLEPDPATEALARTSAPKAADVAQERVFAELRRILAAREALDGLALLDRTGVTAAILPELSRQQGIAQNRFHHLDVHDHTLAALQAAIDLERDPAPAFGPELAPRIKAALAEPFADGMRRSVALRFGVLLHDAAKPATRAVSDDGRVTFFHHDAEGAELARAVCTRLRTSEKLRAHVAALTRHHLRLGFLVHSRPLDRRQIYRYLVATGPVAVDVTLLSVADRLATRGDNHDRAIEAHLEVARDVLAAALDHEEDPPRALIRGDELSDALGRPPGPETGRLLAALAEARYAGEVSTRDEAVDLARKLSVSSDAEADEPG